MQKLQYLFASCDLAKESLKGWARGEDTPDNMLSAFRIPSNAISPAVRAARSCGGLSIHMPMRG